MDLLGFLVNHIFQFGDVQLLLGRYENSVTAEAAHPRLFKFFESYVLTRARSKVISVLLDMGVGVDFVEHHNHRLLAAAADVVERFVDNLYLFLEIRMGDVDNVNQQIGLANLVEGRLERLDKMGRQLADKPYGIGQKHRQIVYDDLPDSGVERGEKLVLGKHVALAQQVHQRRLADVGISDEGNARQLAAVLALHCLLAVDGSQLLLKPGYARQDYAAVGLYLGLAGATHTDTAALALEVSPHSRQARQQILILSQNLTETDMWKDFFEYLREEPLAGENIYVFQTQELEKLLGWKEGGTSVGEYITGLMENRMDREQKNGVTLRQVYYQWYQNGTLKKLPKITLSEDQIQVWLE